MAEIPDCNDSPLDLLRKILLQLISMATNPPASLSPGCSDSSTDLYRKILMTFQYISGGIAPPDPFVPTGTYAWYKSDSGVTLNGSNITTWGDQSGNGLDLTNSGIHEMAYVTNVLNGYAAIRGDGTDKSLQYGNFPTTGIIEWTIIFVASSGAAQAVREVVVGMRDDPTSRWAFGVGNDPLDGSGWGGNGGNNFAGQGLVANTAYTRSYVKTATQWDIYQNGMPIIAGVADVTNPSDPLQFFVIGGESNNIIFESTFNLSGDIFEVLIYASALTAQQRGAVEAYLRNRYAHY